MSHRMQMIDELILQKISKQIQEIFPGEFVSITKVETSKDLSYSKIWVSRLNDSDEFVKMLEERVKEIRHNLSQESSLRIVPFLKFVPDHTSEKANQIEELIKKANDES